jgi:hypothetical protein
LRPPNGGRVHAHHLPLRINQRPAGIAGVQGRVGLQDVVDEPAGFGAQRAPQSAYYPTGHGVLEAVGVTDGND